MEKIKWIEEYLDEALRLAKEEGHEPALRLLNRLLYEEPGYARLHYVIGLINFDFAENEAVAERHLKLAIQFDRSNAEAYLKLGYVLQSKEAFDEAIEVYLSGLEAKKPNRTELFFGAAEAYELKRRYRKAITHYRKALGHSTHLWNCRVIEESIKRCKRKSR